MSKILVAQIDTDELDKWFIDYIDTTWYVVPLKRFIEITEEANFEPFARGYLQAAYEEYLEEFTS